MYLFAFVFRFHIIIIVRIAVPTSQTSRRLTGNWREVAIYIHFCKILKALMPMAATFFCFFTSIMTIF